MKNDILKCNLKRLESEYKKILIQSKEELLKNNSQSIIDGIIVFWYKNKKFINTVLNNISEAYSSYIFTGATFLDLSDFEHFPFVALGKYHFLDDPVCRYAQVLGKSKNVDFDAQTKEQLKLTIEDNIKILENYSDQIYILPIGFLTEVDSHLIWNASLQAFFSLFKNPSTIRDKYSNLKTIDDIIPELNSGIEQHIILSEDDDVSLELSKRVERYIQTSKLPLADTATEAEIFRFALISNMMQAFHIILMCSNYKMIPYIRYSVCFKYVLNLSCNFDNNQEISDMIFKCSIAYILYNCFDKSKIKSVDFKNYCSTLKQENFSDRVFNELKQSGISTNNPSLSKIREIIVENLQILYYELI